MKMISQNRINWIDWSKAILIVLMVLGHSSMPEYLKTYIYSFHMPAFFVISGFLYKPKPFWKTITSFLLPIFIFAFLNYLVYILMDEYKQTRGKYIIMMFPVFWFVETLFFIRLLFGNISSKLILHKYNIHYFLSIILIISLTLLPLFKISFPSNFITRLAVCIPFFVFGQYIKNKNLVSIKNFFLSFVTFVLLMIVVHYYGRCDLGSLQFGLSYASYYLIAITLSLCFFILCTTLKSNKIASVLSIGTLVVLGIHRIILAFFHKLDTIDVNLSYISFIIGTIIVVITSYFLVVFILKKCPFVLGISKQQ